MSTDIHEFYHEFSQDVFADADADGRFVEDVFFSQFCEYLIEAGELETADRSHYVSPRGLRVDGYGGDPAAADGVLSLIIVDYSRGEEVESLTASEMEATFKRLLNFLTKALDQAFRDALEESSAAFGLAELIAASWSGVSKVRLFLLSNRQLSSRVDGREEGEIKKVPVTYSVWDIGRLFRLAVSGRGREEINIDLESQFGGAIFGLPAHLDDAGYEAYLAVVPGEQLAAIYDRWGARLLEQNVRCFLQARGNVNKGIRNTIENNPEMFFAYNNGITATAESIESKPTRNGLQLTKIKNLQIVNGGQTTASIHAASRKKGSDLSRVFVQMKLSIVEPEKAQEVVPKISEYANSQNKVSAADFFANHPFHLRMEDFSRRLYAPSPDGTFLQSKWFYERARGQYEDARAYLSQAQKKRFDTEYPRRQLISKTDLAKYLNVWLGRPEVVSKGAQKNFADFASQIGKQWAEQSDTFNEAFFRHAIAKAIVFLATERIVSAQLWYEGGYRANIVAYAIAKLGNDVERYGGLDFDRIWKSQKISEALTQALALAATAAHSVITDPPLGTVNVTEWAKHSACWTRVQTIKVEWPKGMLEELVSREEVRQAKRFAVKEQRVLNGIEAQVAVVNAGAGFWKTARMWGEDRHLLSQKEIEILGVAVHLPSTVPTDKQSLAIVDILAKLRTEGCPLTLEGR